MRIALFSGNYNYLREGANQALNRLVGYLEDVGKHQVRVYSPITGNPDFEPVGTLIPVPSVRLPVRGEFQLALGLPRKIRIDLEKFSPEIIHVSTPDILCTRAQTFGLRRGIPVVASLHTHFETYLEFYRLGWARPLVEAHLNRFYRRANHVLTPTAHLAARMKDLRGDDCASVWSRGVDRTLFSPQRRDMAWRRDLGIQDDEVAVLFFGRLVVEKGIDVFVGAIAELQRRGRRVRPVLIGAGPALSAFERLGSTVATGHLQGCELARAVASTDIMLTPSTTETFGNVVLEAMASGLPIVSADVPSARALLEHGRTGFLCMPRDIAAYVKWTEQLALDRRMRLQIGATARCASEGFTWEAASKSVDRAYRSFERAGRIIQRESTHRLSQVEMDASKGAETVFQRHLHP